MDSRTDCGDASGETRFGAATSVPTGRAPVNTPRVASIHRQLARVHAELAEELERSDAADDEWADQYHSPLGKRKHLDLVREGVRSGKKPDRVHVYVRRSMRTSSNTPPSLQLRQRQSRARGPKASGSRASGSCTPSSGSFA